jgi:glycosyltransferase involved in cell wall biosynthesis
MVSERVKDDIVGRLRVVSGSKSAVIPLGLELDRFACCESERGSFRKRFGIPSDTMLVGIVGRLVPIKNHAMFLSVVKSVKEMARGFRVKYVIVGDGELRHGLERLSEASGIKDDVIFTGWISDLSGVYADLDVVAMTSLNEGTPVSIIEAMASARAVISTDVGGVRDVIEDGANGVLVRTGDVEAFSLKVISLLNDGGLRAALGARGRESVIDRFSKGRLARDVRALYGDLIAAKGLAC